MASGEASEMASKQEQKKNLESVAVLYLVGALVGLSLAFRKLLL